MVFNVLILSLTTLAHTPADEDSGVKGKIIDKSTRSVLEYATVMVYSLPDSTFVIGGITDKNGRFELVVNPGKYYLTVQFLGYKTVNYNNVIVSKGNKMLDVGEIMIAPDNALLEEVEVVAEKSTLEMTLDKRVFNIGKDVSNTAGNAIEVLENIPSVAVDIDGNVSLRGDEGVRILIDGKVSGLAGINSNDALKSLQADMIERIEIITNPSVRYDAEGSAGIINIILKNDRRRGFNGTVDLSTGYPEQYGVGLNANYRLNKFNFFANYALNYRNRIGGGSTYREFYRENNTFITDQESDQKRTNLGNTFRVGTEYFFSDKESLSLSFMYRIANSNNNSTILYHDYTLDIADSDEFSERVDKEDEYDPNLEYSLNYKKEFKRKNQVLTANFRYFNNDEDENSSINESIYGLSAYPDGNPISLLIQNVLNDESEKNIQASVDYVHPFWRKAVFETGLKYTKREIDNDYEVEEQDSLGVFNNLPEYTNHFLYDEQITAGYLMLGNDFGRYSFQLGVRGEFANVQTILEETEQDYHQKYFDIFPSLHLNYKMSEQDQIQVSYSRRVRRPFYRMLNPFHSLSDNRNIRTGNPDLKPLYTDSYELGYLHYWKISSLNFNAYYRHSVNTFRHMQTLDSITGITYSMPWNFGSDDSYGLEIIGTANFVKWLNLNGNLNFYKSVTVGDFQGEHYLTDYLGYGGRLVMKFNISKGFDAQLSGNYRGPRETPQGKSQADYWADLGISKDVFNGKGTISLNVRDIFATRGFRDETFGTNYYQKSNFKWSKTTIRLNFNYRINQQNKPKKMKDSDGGGGDSEMEDMMEM